MSSFFGIITTLLQGLADDTSNKQLNIQDDGKVIADISFNEPNSGKPAHPRRSITAKVILKHEENGNFFDHIEDFSENVLDAIGNTVECVGETFSHQGQSVYSENQKINVNVSVDLCKETNLCHPPSNSLDDTTNELCQTNRPESVRKGTTVVNVLDIFGNANDCQECNTSKNERVTENPMHKNDLAFQRAVLHNPNKDLKNNGKFQPVTYSEPQSNPSSQQRPKSKKLHTNVISNQIQSRQIDVTSLMNQQRKNMNESQKIAQDLNSNIPSQLIGSSNTDVPNEKSENEKLQKKEEEEKAQEYKFEASTKVNTTQRNDTQDNNSLNFFGKLEEVLSKIKDNIGERIDVFTIIFETNDNDDDETNNWFSELSCMGINQTMENPDGDDDEISDLEENPNLVNIPFPSMVELKKKSAEPKTNSTDVIDLSLTEMYATKRQSYIFLETNPLESRRSVKLVYNPYGNKSNFANDNESQNPPIQKRKSHLYIYVSKDKNNTSPNNDQNIPSIRYETRLDEVSSLEEN